MSKHETPITRRFWRKTGGTLIEEFVAVEPGKDTGGRYLDGLIIKGGPRKVLKSYGPELRGKSVICVQTKDARLGMSLIGQAYVSKELLLKYFHVRSVETVALCTAKDKILEKIAKQMGIKVVYTKSAKSKKGLDERE